MNFRMTRRGERLFEYSGVCLTHQCIPVCETHTGAFRFVRHTPGRETQAGAGFNPALSRDGIIFAAVAY